MNPNYIRDKEIIMKDYRENINELNSILTSSLLDRKIPSVIISIISDYEQNLIDTVVLNNFEDFWIHNSDSNGPECLSCRSSKTVLFYHNSDTICKFGHVEITFEITNYYCLCFKHNLFGNDVGDETLGYGMYPPPYESRVNYDHKIWKYMQNIDKMWLQDFNETNTRYWNKRVD